MNAHVSQTYQPTNQRTSDDSSHGRRTPRTPRGGRQAHAQRRHRVDVVGDARRGGPWKQCCSPHAFAFRMPKTASAACRARVHRRASRLCTRRPRECRTASSRPPSSMRRVCFPSHLSPFHATLAIPPLLPSARARQAHCAWLTGTRTSARTVQKIFETTYNFDQRLKWDTSTFPSSLQVPALLPCPALTRCAPPFQT